MKITIESQVLAKNLTVLKKVVPTTSTVPVLQCFLFKINEHQLTIVASDLETTLQIETPATCSEANGSYAVAADLLMEIIKSLSDPSLILNFSEKELEIESISGNYNMAVDDPKAFPETPEVKQEKEIILEAHILNKALSSTLFATGTDELRPSLTGVCLDFKTDELVFVATDANKLVKYTRTDIKSDEAKQLIIPKKPIQVLTTALMGKDEEVKIGYNNTNIAFEMEGTKMICRLIDVKYPNYEGVIPKDNPNTLEINRAELLKSIKRISIFANKTTHQLIFDKKGNSLTILSEDKDYNNKAVENLTCIGDGDDLKIGFNARFLGEMLSNLTSEKIKIEMSQPNRAGVITPIAEKEDSESILMLVMPVLISK
jgi:DNA polymerase-3 subunit beta